MSQSESFVTIGNKLIYLFFGTIVISIDGSFQFDFFLIALCGSWLLWWQYLIEKVFSVTMGIGLDWDDENPEIFLSNLCVEENQVLNMGS